MRWVWRTGVAAGGVLLAASLATAQIPGGAPVGVGAAPVAGGPGAAVVGAEPKLGFFGKVCAGIDACRRKLCTSPAGQFLNNATKAPGALTGGIIPPFCPIMPSAQDLAKPGVAGASDAIKKDAIEAQMRRDKVRFLGTVDCRYYPDAIGALTAALRTDGSECVRYEAAVALNRGCCCNQRTIDALDATVSGTEKDGNPAERSVRVRCVAAIALERCLSCYVPPVPEPVETIEVKPELKGIEKAPPPPPSDRAPIGPKSNDAPPLLKLPDDSGSTNKVKPVASNANRPPSKESVAMARRTLNEFNALIAASRPQALSSPPGERYSIYQIIKNSAAPRDSVTQTGGITENSVVPMPPSPTTGRPTLGQPRVESSAVAPSFLDAMPSTAAPPLAPRIPTAGPTGSGGGGTRPELMPMAPTTPIASVTPPGAPSRSMVVAQPASPTASPIAANPIAPVVAQVVNGSTAMDRHTAIRQLVRFDWQKNPVVASALVAGAKSDPVPAVRVDCLRHLAEHQMAHPQVLTELAGLAQDNDPWVREEAGRALARLKPTP